MKDRYMHYSFFSLKSLTLGTKIKISDVLKINNILRSKCKKFGRSKFPVYTIQKESPSNLVRHLSYIITPKRIVLVNKK